MTSARSGHAASAIVAAGDMFKDGRQPQKRNEATCPPSQGLRTERRTAGRIPRRARLAGSPFVIRRAQADCDSVIRSEGAEPAVAA